MTAERSHRFAITGQDPEGNSRTIILWPQADLIEGSGGAPGGAHAGRHDENRDDPYTETPLPDSVLVGGIAHVVVVSIRGNQRASLLSIRQHLVGDQRDEQTE